MPWFDPQFSLPTGYRFLIKDIIRFIDHIDSYAGENCKLLDIGCGDQPYRKMFRKYSYTGLDLHTEISKPDITGDILDMPLADSSFDAALTVWVLDDIPEPAKAIAEITRILKPGGYYFAVENQSTNQHFKGHDFFRFAPQALEYLASKNNLDLLEIKSYGGDFALAGFTLITAFNTMFNRVLGRYNYLKPIYSFIINILFFPADRFFRIKFFRKNFEKNSIGYCYVFRKKI